MMIYPHCYINYSCEHSHHLPVEHRVEHEEQRQILGVLGALDVLECFYVSMCSNVFPCVLGCSYVCLGVLIMRMGVPGSSNVFLGVTGGSYMCLSVPMCS